jgi:glycosyltransferase involved in cell wall biosynthesis
MENARIDTTLESACPDRSPTEDGMIEDRKADVVVALDGDETTCMRCLSSALVHGGASLRRLIVVDDATPWAEASPSLEKLTRSDSRVSVVRNAFVLGRVGSCNRGLSECMGDAVLLGSDVIATQGWLAELALVAHAEERTACVAPLTNELGPCSVMDVCRGGPAESVDEEQISRVCRDLPRWTAIPCPGNHCVYLRGDVIDAVGRLDPAFSSLDTSVDDWTMKAQAVGFAAKRSNHSFVRRAGVFPVWNGSDSSNVGGRKVLDERYPHLGRQLAAFSLTLDGPLAAHAIRLESTGKLRVAYDLRHLPREQVGTRTYAVSLARALAGQPGLDLTLLVRDPAQAEGLQGRVLTPDQWRDDVAVIHRPAQFIDHRELKLLFESSAHLVVTHQDLIGFNIPLVFPNDREFDQYRATSRLCLQAVQRILAYSEAAANEIESEFGVPREEISVVSLGVEADRFARREARDVSQQRKLRLPERFFFSLATDFPHKNLPSLLDAYAIFRGRWSQGTPPGLVLAGHTSTARTGFYRSMSADGLGEGVTFLGSVTSQQLRYLYQEAEALVFPSLYEGFGLPPLEAMAAGTPVVAMPISAVPEVGGDCVLYPDSLSPEDLARAIDRIASDDELRESLSSRGRERAALFRWEKTAAETVAAYRTAVLRPSHRSLQMRRMLREAILCWSEPLPQHAAHAPAFAHHPIVVPEKLGIKESWNCLNLAVRKRVKRELTRFRPASKRKTA